MGETIGSFFDALIPFAGGLFLLISYFRKSNSHFYKKRWVIICSTVLLLASGYKAYDKALHIYQKEVPTSEEMLNLISDEGRYVEQDTLIESKLGFKLLIPSGYVFTLPNKRMALVATKEMSDGTRNTATVGIIDTGIDLDATVKETLEYLLSKNPTYRFDQQSHRDQGTVKIGLEVTRNEIPAKGWASFCKKGRSTFFLLVVTSKANWELSETEVSKILESFTF